ncbi:hypothetical protein B0H21DRAFT_94124 [Amylocystis lapponica]|nr:hypothetical protein B0H21DRAFT_94124 [Amylocystis lapponica]
MESLACAPILPPTVCAACHPGTVVDVSSHCNSSLTSSTADSPTSSWESSSYSSSTINATSPTQTQVTNQQMDIHSSSSSMNAYSLNSIPAPPATVLSSSNWNGNVNFLSSTQPTSSDLPSSTGTPVNTVSSVPLSSANVLSTASSSEPPSTPTSPSPSMDPIFSSGIDNAALSGTVASFSSPVSIVAIDTLSAPESILSTASISTESNMSPPSTSAHSQNSRRSSDLGAIIGGAVGGLVIVVLVVIAAIHVVRRHRALQSSLVSRRRTYERNCVETRDGEDRSSTPYRDLLHALKPIAGVLADNTTVDTISVASVMSDGGDGAASAELLLDRDHWRSCSPSPVPSVEENRQRPVWVAM